jgi:hypothetical protein
LSGREREKMPPGGWFLMVPLYYFVFALIVALAKIVECMYFTLPHTQSVITMLVRYSSGS